YNFLINNTFFLKLMAVERRVGRATANLKNGGFRTSTHPTISSFQRFSVGMLTVTVQRHSFQSMEALKNS
ncbi:hypothetical protein QUF54_01330, partial [Candidatus Marithioploca araucensis]|nr:hypothetical protein [Candidatus Marithioploca araucensis]